MITTVYMREMFKIYSANINVFVNIKIYISIVFV